MTCLCPPCLGAHPDISSVPVEQQPPTELAHLHVKLGTGLPMGVGEGKTVPTLELLTAFLSPHLEEAASLALHVFLA